MADNTNKMSFQAGEAKGQAEVSLWIFFFISSFLFMNLLDFSLLIHEKAWILFVSGEGQYLGEQSW
jgi:hypothetical protein